MELKSKIREALEGVLAGQEAMHCNRVWEAWGYGTMTEDDFTLVVEDMDCMDELADAVLAVLLESPHHTKG